MAIIVIILVKLLDPISFIVVLVVSFFLREKWIIPVAAIVGAVATETMLASTQITRIWGQGIIPGFISSGIHAIICYWLLINLKIMNQANLMMVSNKT
ncbi:MAG: hypothetical protein C4527_06410 [Candidatus Omnitrophota bacterium]|nr:MAG: hypothetical protein C4527_06410 [Candidatus Omnitrophota bacterium]